MQKFLADFFIKKPDKILLSCFLFSFLILASKSLFAVDEVLPVKQLIRQMSEANHKLSYEGILIYQHQGKVDAMRIIHKVDEDEIQERIVSLTGFAYEVLRNKNSVTYIFPDDESVMVEKSRPRQFNISQLSEQMSKVSGYYTISIAGQDRIANRSALVVDILPKDDYRYGYQLWIDLKSKLLLKSELKNREGIALEKLFFAELKIVEEISDELLKPEISGAGYTEYTWHDNSSKNFLMHEGDASWKATWAPDGFTMSSKEKQSSGKNETPIEHLIYSDDMAMISVFIEKLDKSEDVVTGFSSIGGVNTFSTISNGHLITAIGEVPKDTVKLLAKSIVSNK